MTAPKLPEGLEPVAFGFLGPWKERNKLDWKPRNKLWEPLVRLSDAQAALQALAAEKDALESRAEIAEQAHVCAAEERDHLRAIVKDLRPDAERYRWLREQAEPNRGGEKPWCTVRDSKGHAWAFGGSLDAAIDSAIALAAKEAK